MLPFTRKRPVIVFVLFCCAIAAVYSFGWGGNSNGQNSIPAASDEGSLSPSSISVSLPKAFATPSETFHPTATYTSTNTATATATPTNTPTVAPTASVTPTGPQYQIFDIGVVQAGDTASQGQGVSTGGVAVGRSIRTGGAQAFTYIGGAGITGLPNLPGRSFAVANAAIDSGAGTVVGTAANTLFGTARLPVLWHGGVVSQLQPGVQERPRLFNPR